MHNDLACGLDLLYLSTWWSNWLRMKVLRSGLILWVIIRRPWWVFSECSRSSCSSLYFVLFSPLKKLQVDLYPLYFPIPQLRSQLSLVAQIAIWILSITSFYMFREILQCMSCQSMVNRNAISFMFFSAVWKCNSLDYHTDQYSTV